jgi:hypothetical protein
MRQWADLAATRRALQSFGGRIVFVPRQKTVEGDDVFYLSVDMPMGDLSLLGSQYRSRMFQFVGAGGRELLIHDMKTVDSLSVALRTILRQLQDPDVLASAHEQIKRTPVAVDTQTTVSWPYGAPAPEFE